jgi:hypothetical protein
MPTYATIQDFKTYAPQYAALSDNEITSLLEHAERDVDTALGAHSVNDDTGLKFDPVSLTVVRKNSLTQATCAQAEYRQLMGPTFFIRGQYASVSGPDFQTQGKLPRVGPKVWDELGRADLLRLTTTWCGVGDDPPWRDFAYG